MSEENKKTEQSRQEAKAAELTDQDLDNVAGGAAGEGIDDVGVGLGKKPNPSIISAA